MSSHFLFAGLPPEGPLFEDLQQFCQAHRSHVLASLPWLAAELAGNDGFAMMLRLVRELSGDRLHVSGNLDLFRKRLGLNVSARTHERLLRGLGEAHVVDVPSAWGVFIALRRVAITQDLAAGREHREIAKRFGVTARSLRKLVSD